MGLRDDVPADLLERLLSRQRLRQMRPQPVHLRVILAPKQRHVCDHRQHMYRGRMGLGREHLPVSNPHPGTFCERRTQIGIDAGEYPARRAP